jgi:hypothetical protein
MRKLISALGLLLSAAGFVVFLALAVGVWYAKREADKQMNTAVARAHQAGDVACQVIKLVREVVARAKASLSTARTESQPAASQPVDPMVKFAMWKAKKELPGEVEKARDAVHIASEAVIIAESFLDVFVEHKPDETALGVRAGDITAARTQLESAAGDLRNVRTVLGVPVGTVSAEQYSQVDQALTTATDVTNRVDDALKDARIKVDAAKAAADHWSVWLAVIVTALGTLAAVGQVFLFRACRRGLKPS